MGTITRKRTTRSDEEVEILANAAKVVGQYLSHQLSDADVIAFLRKYRKQLMALDEANGTEDAAAGEGPACPWCGYSGYRHHPDCGSPLNSDDDDE